MNMKQKSLVIIGALTAGALALPIVAHAETIEEVCTAAVKAADAGDAALAGCACLQEQVDGKPALEEELISLRDYDTFEARYEAASDDGKASLDACFGPQE